MLWLPFFIVRLKCFILRKKPGKRDPIARKPTLATDSLWPAAEVSISPAVPSPSLPFRFKPLRLDGHVCADLRNPLGLRLESCEVLARKPQVGW